MSTGVFKRVDGVRVELTQEELDAFEASRQKTTAQQAAKLVLTANQFWLSISTALGLTPADGDPKAYLTAVIQGSTRLNDTYKVLAIAQLNSAHFARADDAKTILETVGMDLNLGVPQGQTPDEATRLAMAQAALDTLFIAGAQI